MYTHVNTVLVADKAVVAEGELKKGAVALFNEKGAICTSEADVKASKQVRFGLVTGMSKIVVNGVEKEVPVLRYSQWIQRDKVATPGELAFKTGKAPKEQTYTFDLACINQVGNHTDSSLKILYKDLNSFKTQISKTYTTFGAAIDAAAEAKRLVKRINSDLGSRVVATAAGTVVTIKAKEDTTNSVNSLDEYSQVNFELYPNVYLDGTPIDYRLRNVAMVEETVKPFPGLGFWKQVRDAERKALPYIGADNRVYFPGNLTYPELMVKEGQLYDVLTIEWNNCYRSADNQYIKNTPLAVEVYVATGQASPLAALIAAIKA